MLLDVKHIVMFLKRCGISLIQSQGSGYGLSSEMGFCLWDLEAIKVVCSHDVVFNEEKMHKKRVYY